MWSILVKLGRRVGVNACLKLSDLLAFVLNDALLPFEEPIAQIRKPANRFRKLANDAIPSKQARVSGRKPPTY